MSFVPGRLTAELAEPPTEDPTEELVSLVNENIKPPTDLSPEDLYIRAMYIASDRINSFGGRFPRDELDNLARLLVDSPVMVGHRKDRLPIGRNFHATVEHRKGGTWVKAYFYWLKGSRQAEDLKENIDGGIYKECSIGFTFRFAHCSICGQDIRRCGHQPLKSYPSRSGPDTVCCFEYRQIEKVLETSLVYRGAQSDTSITRDLGITDSTSATGLQAFSRIEPPFELDSLAELDFDQRYLVVPNYDSIPVLADSREGHLKVLHLTGEKIDSTVIAACGAIPEGPPRFGWLIGYRGKERCSSVQLRRRLRRLSSPITRVELRLFPVAGEEELTGIPSANLLPSKTVTHHQLDAAVRSIRTCDGVLIWPLASPPPQFAGFRYRGRARDERLAGWYRLVVDSESLDARLETSCESGRDVFLIRGFGTKMQTDNAHYVAERWDPERCNEIASSTQAFGGKIERCTRHKSALQMELSGEWTTRVTMRPIHLNGRDCFLASINAMPLDCRL